MAQKRTFGGDMETDPHRWIAALRNSQDRLTSLVRPLTPQRLRGTSYHAWSIAEVVGHLGSQAELFMGWLTAAVEGREPSPPETMQPVWDAWHDRSPEEQAADSLEYNERLVQRFERLTDEELRRMHLSLFGMELDATNLIRLRLAEHAVHTWDIAVALDPTARIAPDAVNLLIDTLADLAKWVGKPQDKKFRLRVLTSEPERRLSLSVGDEVELRQWKGGKADTGLRIPAEAFLRLIYGRLDPEHTPPVELTGSNNLNELRHIFPGV
jgi:uncharacterized protein (TIGR03083 family)